MSESGPPKDSEVREGEVPTVGDVPRLPPRPKEEWDDEVRAAFRVAFSEDVAGIFLSDAPDAATAPNVLSTLMHHPAIAGPFLKYNLVLLDTPALGPRLRELIVLRVAAHTRSPYEWVQHVRIAQAAGITAEEIEAAAGDLASVSWSPLETDVLAATDQLIDHYRVDDDTWARLAEQLDRAQLVELTFTAGTYTCLAMAFNSFGLEIDPDLQHVRVPFEPCD